MIFIRRRFKYLSRELANTYMTYPLIIQKKAIQILNVNAGIIAISLVLFALKIWSINSYSFSLHDNAASVAQLFIVIILSALSINYIFKEEPEKAVYMLFASMASIFFKDIASGVLDKMDIMTIEFYDTMFVLASIMIIMSFLAMKKEQLTITSIAAILILVIDYSIYSQIRGVEMDFAHMGIMVVEFILFCIFSYMSFTIYEKSITSIIQAGEISTKKYNALFESMSDGFVYCQLVFDDYGEPSDALIMEINTSFEKIVGIKPGTCKREMLSKLYGELFIKDESWIQKLYDVAFNGREIKVRKKLKDRWLSVHSFSPVRGYFVIMLRDVTDSVLASEKLKESEQLYRNLIENSPDAVVMTDMQGNILMASPVSEAILGYECEAIEGKDISNVIDERERAVFLKSIQNLLCEKSIVTKEYTGVKCDGSRVNLDINMNLIKNAGGRIVKMLFFIRDSSERKKAERTFKKIFHSHSSMMYLMDMGKKEIVDANRSAVVFYGYQLVGMSIYDIAADERQKLDMDMQNVVQRGSMNFEEKHIISDDTIRDMKVSMSMAHVEGKKYAFAILNDITEEKKAKEMLEKLSVTDRLTGIYNRLKFDRDLEFEISFARENGYEFSLIMIDIDHFKRVNDTYGHDVGDIVLQQLVEVVKMQIRDTDIFARWGGEEFIVMARMSGVSKAHSLAERIRESVQNSEFKIVGHITCSIGVSSYMDGDTEKSIAKRADEALYAAKEGGRNRVVDQQMHH
ncbi:PAS domain S-box-containing protein/diguanylate cyclase (GGDEF) domain-containing protein [Peptoclostridium litorale DSM 5388]|uniref:Diguanylate cyclase n=2 Tax=Peptoclostridium litorale TaxID=1557 RepID=A0A069RG11_PEPLI|nr:diguanylate cyclase [Peptoclostridium litorale]KDR95961.1 diguanylate cyclase [Peptoclostridium litorale DSM 5388]SIO09149.1 PAS domain S-box-containing protein/diguanylate cyclase (GGDEF) domain-containing protein [Peptoclostridium litorale DSM 5388]